MERKGGRTNKCYESRRPSRVGLNIKLQQASWALSDLSTQTGLEWGVKVVRRLRQRKVAMLLGHPQF